MKNTDLKNYRISFVGAGRVAGNMCREIFKSGSKIDVVISESPANGKRLAEDCKALWSGNYFIPDTTDVIIVSVPDSRLKSVLALMKFKKSTVVAHTAGSLGLDVFPPEITSKGVIYPLQTFSKNRKVNFKSLPVFIEASDQNTSSALTYLARNLGSRVYFADTERRRKLHLAAVFACNFTNHMLTVGKELASEAGYSFEELKPLINETFLKAFEEGPENSQTGPAVRNDKNTIRKHLELLSFDRNLQKVYRDISTSIIKYHNRK